MAFTTSEDAGPTQILIFYFDTQDLEHEIEPTRIEALTNSVITTWQDAVFIDMTKAFGEREGRRLFNYWVTRDTRSGIYREATPPHEVPFDVARLDALEARLLVAVVPRGPEKATLKIYSPKLLVFIKTLETLRNLGLGVTEEMHIPITLPKRDTAHLYRYEIRDEPERITARSRRGEPPGEGHSGDGRKAGHRRLAECFDTGRPELAAGRDPANAS